MPDEGAARRIGGAALDRFARSGYAQTSLSDVARCAGVDQAVAQEEFASMDALVAELTRPLIEQLDALVVAADSADTNDAEEVAEILGQYLGTLVEHRQLVKVLLGDPTAAICPAVIRVRAGLTRLRDLLAGPAGGQDERIRASSALGAIQQAVADFSDVELLASWAVILHAAAATLVTEDRA